MIKKYSVYFIVWFQAFSIHSIAQQHYKFPIVNYTPKDYGKQQSPQNWSIVQNKEGLVYVGNDNGVLEYDGAAWRFIPVINGQKVFSLALDSTNKVFVGSVGNFGFLKTSATGKPEYVSLSDSLLKEEDKYFGHIWRIYCSSKGEVFFQSYEKLFIYSKGKLQVINPSTSFHLALFVHNTLYVRERQKGLLKYQNGELNFVKGSELFAEYGVFGMLPYGEGQNEVLVITQEKGLFLFDQKQSVFTEFAKEENNLWLSAKLFGGIQINKNTYAFNSQLFGSIIINAQGKVEHLISSPIGLQDDYVISQCIDNTGNLWLALNNGLSKVDLSSPLQIFTLSENIRGSVNDVCVYNNETYVATSQGLLKKSTNNAVFEPALGVYNVVWQLKVKEDKLFIVTDDRVLVFNGKTTATIMKGNYRAIHIAESGKLLIGGMDGLAILKPDYGIDYFFDEIAGEILGIDEEVHPDDDVFYVSTQGNLYKIIDNFSNVYKVTNYGTGNGLTKDWIFPFNLNGKILVGTNYGLFAPSTEKNGNVLFEPIDFYGLNVQQKSFYFLRDYSDKTYAIIENKPHVYFKKKKSEVFLPFAPIDLGKENAIFSDSCFAYIALNEGLVIYNEEDKKNYNQPFQVLLRKVILKNDSVLFDGGLANNMDISTAIPYHSNTITVEFSCNYYNYETKNLFCYRIEGIDTSFSTWSTEKKVKLSNLREGDYKLVIRSKNVFEKEGDTFTLTFSIAAPWYRTTIAFVCYGIAFLLIIVAAVKISSMRLKQQNKRLESIVQQRTAEIAHKNDELKEQNIQILHQKQEITDSINYAKRIQDAILPPLKDIKEVWNDIFILFQPKDIVSGDFYWFSRLSETEFIIASCDCTGHGVPGGFMSMVCTDKLNEAVYQTQSPAQMLKHVNVRIKQSLRQDNKSGSTKDGMEIAILKVNLETRQLTYSGANRFLWIIRNGSNELEEIKPTKAAIAGFTDDTQDFEEHVLQANKGDQFYMSTDGYGDQFGGPNGKKLMTRRFKDILFSIRERSSDEQNSLLREEINKWMKGYEQVDDILVIGLKL